jgi:hypothetical protein
MRRSFIMSEDQRCCGTGTCLINADGLCWCGQKWIGDKLIGPEPLGDLQGSSTNESDKPSD